MLHYETRFGHPLRQSQHFSAPDERVWGAAYHIKPSHVAEVKEYLDIREINGYSIQYTPFHPSASAAGTSTYPQTGRPIHCLVYIGLPDNPQFMGPQDPQKLAEHILRSKGPSGQNREYLYMLDEALENLSAESRDGHISDLVERCRALEAERGWKIDVGGEIVSMADGAVLHKVGSTEEQEEVEKDAQIDCS